MRYELTRIIRETLGLPEKVAVPMAECLAVGLSRRYGGMYISKREVVREVRDEAVRREFNGRNREEVMRRHNISKTTLYDILSRGRPAA